MYNTYIIEIHLNLCIKFNESLFFTSFINGDQ